MSTVKGGIPKARGKSRARVFGAASAVLAVGLAISPAGQAASVIDRADEAGNSFQANDGGDVIKPQFALWPLTGNNNNSTVVHYESNDATGRGSGTAAEPFQGQPFLLGFGAGNIAQVSTGGNVVTPQFVAFGDNTSHIETFGNWALDNGQESESVTGGPVIGHVVDGNGNVFQLEFLQGNVINPQFALFGDNTSYIDTAGNHAGGNGSGSTTANSGALAFVDGNGNVVQIVILSHNVINPQVSAGGSNDLEIWSAGNVATGNGNNATTGLSGIFGVTTIVTGNGNITQIAILSNNVWAPQMVLPGFMGTDGSNTSRIHTFTNDAVENGVGSDTTVDALDKTTTSLHQFGNGNIWQQAPFGNGNIDNPQINLGTNHSTPDVVNEEKHVQESPPPAEDEYDVVTESFKAEPGVILTGDNSGGGGNASVKGNWKPGDGVKKVVAAVTKVVHDVTDALTPKPKPESESEPGPE